MNRTRTIRRWIAASLGAALALLAPADAQAADPKPQWSNGGVDNCRHGSIQLSKEICDLYYEEIAAECRADRGYFEKYAPGIDQWACYSCPKDWKAVSKGKCAPVKKAPVFPPTPKPKPKPETIPMRPTLGGLPTVDSPGTKPKPTPTPEAKPKPKPKPTPKPEPKPAPPVPEPEPEPERDPLMPDFVPEGPFTATCEIDEAAFASTWLKFSDIDERIPVGERSFAAKSLVQSGVELRELETARAQLEFDLGVNEIYLESLHEYRDALKRNLQQNLIKATFRLAYVTYATIKASGATREVGRIAAKRLGSRLGGTVLGHAQGLGHNMQNLLDGQAGAIEKLKNLHTLAKSLLPSKKYATDQEKLERHGIESAIQTVLDLGDAATRSGADQIKSGIEAAGNFGGAVNKVILPSADLSKEEIKILADQNESRHSTDRAILDAVQISSTFRTLIYMIDEDLAEVRAKVPKMVERERARVRGMLEEDCKEQLKRFNEAQSKPTGGISVKFSG